MKWLLGIVLLLSVSVPVSCKVFAEINDHDKDDVFAEINDHGKGCYSYYVLRFSESLCMVGDFTARKVGAGGMMVDGKDLRLILHIRMSKGEPVIARICDYSELRMGN